MHVSVNCTAPLFHFYQQLAVSVSIKKWSTLPYMILLACGLTTMSVTSFAQKPVTATNGGEIIVKGVITDSAGNRLTGVTIQETGTKKSTTTNNTGEFELSGVKKNAILSLSMVGFKTIQVKATETVSVTMRESITSLGEVVVTGFQTIKRNQFTGASVSLKGDDVKIDGATDISRMLEGRAAGVAVQNVSSTFGSAPKVRIRGATSITGDNKPLWVVDGVVLEDIVNLSNDQLSSGDASTLLGSSVAGINANDIETFDILKDASATALYGARAMNGVIVITTKKGKAGKTNISYTGNFNTQLKPSYNNFDIMNSVDQMSVYAELERKGYLDFSSIANRADAGVYGKMADLINTVNPDGSFGLANTPEARSAFLLKYSRKNTDWFNILFRNSLSQEHSISLSSGTDKAQTFFSTSFYNDQGWTIADKVKRFTINFRNTYNLSDKLTVGFKIAASDRIQQSPGTISRKDNVVQGQYDRDFDINPFSYALNTSRVLTAYDDNGNLEYFRRGYAPFNIINEVANNTMKLNVIDVALTGDIQYKIKPWLTYNFIGSLRYAKTTNQSEITENSNEANAYRAGTVYGGNANATIAAANKFLYTDPDNPSSLPVSVLPYGGFYNTDQTELKNYTFRNILSFNKVFRDVHDIQGLVGFEVNSSDRVLSNNLGFGYQYNNGGIPFVDYRIQKQFIENNLQYYGKSDEFNRFLGYFGDLRYTYNRKYTIQGTYRRDGSNRLGASPDARWINTWTVAGRWNVDQEGFMEKIPVISSLVVRGSYGLNANYGSATNSLAVLKTQITNRPYTNDRQLAINIENLKNADLTWERKYEADVGLDVGIYDNRILFSGDLYHRKSFDLINLIRTSAIGGELDKAANYADMKSYGAEFSLGGTPIKTRNFSWFSNFTFGHNKTEITRAENFPLIYDLVKPEGGAAVGHAVRGLYSIRFQGLDQFGVPTFTDETGKTSAGVYLQSDKIAVLKYEGPVDPTIFGGFTNNFTYKNFFLGVHISYQAGNKIRLYPAFRAAYSDLDASPNEFKNRWSLPGDEKLTNVPAIADKSVANELNNNNFYPYNNYNYSDQRVVDGSFVRVKSISLRYTFPAGWIARTPIKTASLGLLANNMFLLYSDKDLHGQDPEFFNAGGVAQPIAKQFNLSLKLGF